MARTKPIRTQTKEVSNYLSSLNKNVRSAANKAIANVLDGAVDAARIAIYNTDHTQKFGDLLAYAVDWSKEPKGEFYISAPNFRDLPSELASVDKDVLRQQMYYLEYGAGMSSGPSWGYETTEYDKSPVVDPKSGRYLYQSHGNRTLRRPIKFISRRAQYGWLGLTNISKPANYMKTARRYVIKNAENAVKGEINFVISRKNYRPLDRDEEYV